MWTNPSKRLTPSVYHAKQMICRLKEDRGVVLFCDLHGHSRKHNIFCYGCEVKGQPVERLAERIFPFMLGRAANVFAFRDCSFRIQRQKESTARVVVFHEMKIANAFTLEASFAGANFGKESGRHFTPKHLREIGHCFCDCILDYQDPNTRAEVHNTLLALYPEGVMATEGGDSGGSDDNPSEDCADPLLIERQIAKKKRLSTRETLRRPQKCFWTAPTGRQERKPPPPHP